LARLLRLQRNGFTGGILELFGANRTAGDDLAAGEIEHGDRRMRAVFTEDAHHADLARDDASATGLLLSHRYQPSTWIWTSTAAERSSFISASTVCGVGWTISSTRLNVRISNCSRLFLST